MLVGDATVAVGAKFGVGIEHRLSLEGQILIAAVQQGGVTSWVPVLCQRQNCEKERILLYSRNGKLVFAFSALSILMRKVLTCTQKW